jgi:N6-L-threonylcarbamoyladenine synthase
MIARLAGIEITDETFTISSISSSNQDIEYGFQPKIEFPFLTFLASGGHTSILLCKGLGDYEFLGGTLDDALGEAFDKAARLLGLQSSLSGGAAVEEMARIFKEKYHASFENELSISSHNLKVPMREKPGCDFSYAGI